MIPKIGFLILAQRGNVPVLQMPLDLQTTHGVPDMLQHYHSLYLLDDTNAGEQASRAFGVQSVLYKGVSAHDGAAFAILKFGWRQVIQNASLTIFQIKLHMTA